MTATMAQARLRELANHRAAISLQRYFKTGPGEYGEGQIFIGIRVPQMRLAAKDFNALPIDEIDVLLQSDIHEERLLALMVMSLQYHRGDDASRGRLHRLYLRRTRFVNNWDLVDDSAPTLVGRHLLDRDARPIHRLSRSRNWWERRIAIISTFYFIRRDRFGLTLELAERLRDDEHDLIRKAVGWMLREVGKREAVPLRAFLDQHAHAMPRVMLRYALEKFGHEERVHYLGLKNNVKPGPRKILR